MFTNRFKFNDGKFRRRVANHTAPMSSSACVFEKHGIAGPDAMALSIRGLEFHFSIENEYPHAKRRWMQITDPFGRASRNPLRKEKR